MRKGSHHSQKSIAQMSLMHQGHDTSLETRRKISESGVGRILRQSSRDKISESNRRRVLGRSSKRKMSKSITRLWKNPEYAKKVLRRRSPNYPEQKFINLCIERGLLYQYVGNGELIIEGKNPDFVDSTGTKLIEIWGEHWHRGQNPQDRIDFFRSRGYDCIVIWVSELKHLDLVIKKVVKFDKGGK